MKFADPSQVTCGRSRRRGEMSARLVPVHFSKGAGDGSYQTRLPQVLGRHGGSIGPGRRPSAGPELCPAAGRPVRQGDHHHLSLLRGRVRHHRPHPRRRGDQHRGGSGSSDQPGNAVQQRRVGLPAAPQREAHHPAPLPGEGGEELEAGLLGLGLRSRSPAGSRIPATPPSCRPTTGGRRSTVPTPSLRSAAPPSTTRSATCTRSCCGDWGWSTLNTRREYDTPPRLPVWQPLSAAAP